MVAIVDCYLRVADRAWLVLHSDIDHIVFLWLPFSAALPACSGAVALLAARAYEWVAWFDQRRSNLH